MMEFKQGGDPYEKLKIGRFRERKTGDLVYVKPKALQLLLNKLEDLLFGDVRSLKMVLIFLINADPKKDYLIKRVSDESVLIGTETEDIIELDNFLLSFYSNDDKYDIGLGKSESV